MSYEQIMYNTFINCLSEFRSIEQDARWGICVGEYRAYKKLMGRLIFESDFFIGVN